MITDQGFELLEKSGLFAEWPEPARLSARATIEENEQFRTPEGFPGAAMISAWGDSECIYDEDSYTVVLNDFAEGSHGFFQPTNIKEVWSDLGDGDWSIEVSFECCAKVYTSRIGYEGDWIDDAIFGLINDAMADCNPELIFHMPDVGFGQEFGFLLIPKSLLGPAIEQGLLPPLEEAFEDEGEEDEEDEEDEGDEGDPFPILSLYELAVELDDMEMFEDVWGRLPDHLISFLKRDLDGFTKAVEAGADINATSGNRILAPLRIAVTDEFPEGMEYLLSRHDIDLNQRDHAGDTALSWAIENGSNETAKRLIDAGADIHVINDAGQNLVQFAKVYGNEAMAAFLEAQGVGSELT